LKFPVPDCNVVPKNAPLGFNSSVTIESRPTIRELPLPVTQSNSSAFDLFILTGVSLLFPIAFSWESTPVKKGEQQLQPAPACLHTQLG